MNASLMKIGLGAVVTASVAAAFLQKAPPRGEQTFEFVTPTYEVKGIYKSMKGPDYTNTNIYLSQGKPELLWVRGYEATMVAADGHQQKPQQFMCHNTLSIHRGLDQHRRLFGAAPYGTRRLFTLSQGQYSVDFPKGFGIPILSTEKLMLQSQVLNLNKDAVGDTVRHKIRTNFVYDEDQKEPMKPLCLIPTGIAVPMQDPNAREMPDDAHNLGCAINPKLKDPGAAKDAGGGPLTKIDGKTYTAHWVVNPGREIRRTNVGQLFPFDTTVHYIAVHVHPGAESFELRDLTTGKSLFVAKGEQLTKGVGLDRIGCYSSEQGFPVYRDHDYELISVYDNQTKTEQSAMAFMFCYVLDKQFHKPDSQTMARSDESMCGPTNPAMIR